VGSLRRFEIACLSYLQESVCERQFLGPSTLEDGTITLSLNVAVVAVKLRRKVG
jgi:hypothetical protein